MRFKSFTKKYEFTKDTLIRGFPSYISLPIANWMHKVLTNARVLDANYRNRLYLNNDFLDELHITFREVFPQYWEDTVPFIFSNTNRTADFIALCLQNFTDLSESDELEHILAKGGSAYEVISTKKDATDYEEGVYDLSERVSPIVKEQAGQALDKNELLQQAWQLCYSRNPDYEKVVSRCCDFIENFLGNIYFPKDPKPQLKKFVHAFEQNPKILDFKGDSVVDPKSSITSLLREASNIRGQHVAGQGRKPAKEEAEFVLHTTIYIWNLHQR